MGTVLNTSICAYCGKRFILTNPKTKRPKFCDDECKRLFHSSAAIKKAKTKQPNVTISDIGNFQTYYKSKTGRWLKYTEAAQMLEDMSKNELKSLRSKWATSQL